MPITDTPDVEHVYAGGALRMMMPAPRIDLSPDGPAVSVVIPAMNEAKNLPWLAARMPAGVAEIVLVDGRSVDDTVAVARALWPEVRVVGQRRRGKGNALACGFEAATGDIIVMIDADGSMDPGEIPYFVAALTAGADYAKGSRFTAGGGSSDITRLRGLGNRALNGLTGLLHRTLYTDLCYGYNAFWRSSLPAFGLDPGSDDDGDEQRRWGDGFEVETLLNIRAHVSGLTITEVASYETPRIHGQSNLNAVSDGLRVLKVIAHERLRQRRAINIDVNGTTVEAAAVVPRSALVASEDVLDSSPMDNHRDIEWGHDRDRGSLDAVEIDDAEGIRHTGAVRPLSPRDLEVIDLASYEREKQAQVARATQRKAKSG